MTENLVIVESPAKAKTIEKFLGKNFVVKSSFGHIRDLSKKDLGIDLKNQYTPVYIISEEKKKVVSELKKLKKEAKIIWLASDEDREGEAISWHLFEVLGLSDKNTRRIVFHEITKTAILKAIETPREINKNLVLAQQARRVLDRLVGFELSPVLWKKIQPSLSAGRVQSVAVRLLVERERDVLNFKPTSFFRVTALFTFKDEKGKEIHLKAELNKKLSGKEAATNFIQLANKSNFKISGIETKPLRRSPSPPFTTSTLQQEAGRKLGFSVAQTMSVAQKLYESGKITYMRTDSVNLSSLALNMAKEVIISQFGEKYQQLRNYKTKSKGAQEAHEAIRPTYPEQKDVQGSQQEKKLYNLIWKRTIASQMSQAEIEKTTATISMDNSSDVFIATGEVIKFDGFLKLYTESQEERPATHQGYILPPLKQGQPLQYLTITATERFTQAPFRYSEASLVKKMEELGIGRPSTYAPTISTIQHRGYVVKENLPGTERKIRIIELNQANISEKTQTEKVGKEKSKLVPTDIGMLVNDFLIEHFSEILDYNFTANAEKEFDEIAAGKLEWAQMIDNFYKKFHQKVEKSLKLTQKTTGEKVLGKDPDTGEEVLVKVGRYGPVAQLGRVREDYKPRFAGLLKNQRIETISLEEALKLFQLPRKVGHFEEEEIIASIGKFGPYLRHKGKFYSIVSDKDDPLKIVEGRAIEIILEKRETDRKKVIKTFKEEAELFVLNGRWGPYISFKKKNFKIPRGTKPEELDFSDCMKIISEGKTHKASGKKK